MPALNTVEWTTPQRINGSQDITLSYDAENRLTGMSGGVTSSYVYDADGKRVKETIAGVTRVFVGNYYELDNGVVKKYYYAGATRVAESSGGVLYFLLSDHLGSTALTLDSSGVRQTELRYYPFGAARYNANNQVTTYRFTGQRWDSGTALYFYQSRWYDPLSGRFLAADTIIPQPGNPQSLYRYSYVGNRPLRFVDPTGHAQVCGAEVDGGCGGLDALHTIESLLMQGKLDPLAAKQAYFRYYLTHPTESPDGYHPLTRNPAQAGELKGNIMSTAYAQAQAASPASNLGGVVLDSATTNGAIASSLAEYGGKAAFGIYAAGVVGRWVGFGGGVLAEDEQIVVFESARGSGRIKTHDPEGQSAQSLAVAGSPEQAYRDAFGRHPGPGEPYWQTTAGQIAATGRFAYLDAAGSPGHVSIYGGSYQNPIEFIKIWTRRIFGP